MSKNFVCVLLILLSLSCASTGWHLEREIATVTGEYKVYRASCREVQSYWNRVNPDYYLVVDGLSDWRRGIILYCTDEALKEELHNVQSYRNLVEAAEGDRLMQRTPLVDEQW